MTTIWHNPRCSKSRETLTLLKDRGIDPDVRLYLAEPPTGAELRATLKKLGIRAIDLMRTKETEFKAAGLTAGDSEDKLIAAMVAHPKLIERPVVFEGDRAALGRPPESVLKLFA